MKADPYDIKTVFGFERQLFAPLFQRPYVWNETEQWEPLWNDIRKMADGGQAMPKPVRGDEHDIYRGRGRSGHHGDLPARG